MPYYVYVVELDKSFARTARAKRENPSAVNDKPCIYVGQSSKKPEERFSEHINGLRNNRVPLFSRIVKQYGIRLQPRLYEKYNPLKTRSEAEKKEKEVTIKYRKRGYTVWSN